MALFDFMHKWTKRFDSRKSKYVYDAGRGIIEPWENLPAGPSGKQTVILETTGAIFPAALALAAGLRGYITKIEFAYVPPGPFPAGHQVALNDAVRNLAHSQTDVIGIPVNDSIGDGSAVVSQWTGTLTAVQVSGVVTLCFVRLTYYTRSTA